MEPFVKRIEENGIETYRLESWERRYTNLSSGFSTRHGGVSQEAWSSLNCALHVADSPQDVIENRRRLAAAAGFPFEAWTCGEQVHNSDVAVITRRERGSGRESRETAIANKDALLTNEPDIMLVSFYADCVPLYFYDPLKQAAGLAHAGWKGTAKAIAARTVEAFRSAFGSDPADMVVAIGPSIGPCCYEVDDRVIDALLNSEHAQLRADELREQAWTAKPNGRYMLNLKEVNRRILIKAGILPMNIEVTNLCTSCADESFYSHRRDGGRTGRMASWIGMMKR